MHEVTSVAREAGAGGGGERARRPTGSSLVWAVGLPVAGVLAGVVAQYPYGMWVGVVLGLAVAATTAVVAGGVWHRAWAATFASFAVLALPFFAGPAFYATYAQQAGERVPAVITGTGERQGVKKSAKLSVCRVVEASGAVREVSEQSNCQGQFAAGERVVLFEDPLGALDPWIEAEPGERGVDTVGLGVTAGLFLVAGSALFCAGQRRRSVGVGTYSRR
ncbi:hypothetical protein ABZ858_28300 [Streptomyces sp. NPDC047017]|uniref:hypothetical protein n=1 Tax=Streptomyces sp. NPDC047017 TaxID=3155024 RepID=UPI0033D01152